MAMARLVDIWDSIGIMEDKRVQRMETVKKHIEVRSIGLRWDILQSRIISWLGEDCMSARFMFLMLSSQLLGYHLQYIAVLPRTC